MCANEMAMLLLYIDIISRYPKGVAKNATQFMPVMWTTATTHKTKIFKKEKNRANNIRAKYIENQTDTHT